MNTTPRMSFDKTIYKKDSQGDLRYLRVYTRANVLYQESGLVGTTSPILHHKVCESKNVGRSNETSPQEQALLEAQSVIAEKLKKDYSEGKPERKILPMLAKVYADEKKKVTWESAYVQPKLDGMRALWVDGKLMSRQGNEITTVPHINQALQGVTVIPDGELYAHGLNFQENMRLLKKQRPESVQISYHVYDVVMDAPFGTRYEAAMDAIYDVEGIILVSTFQVSSEEKMYERHRTFLWRGYEGTILRWGNEPYKINGRSSNLLKVKDFQDEAFTILEVIPMETYRDQGMIVCETNGKTFTATPKMSHEERRQLLNNPEAYIGKTAEVRFFERSEDGIPRFPVFVGLRLDK